MTEFIGTVVMGIVIFVIWYAAGSIGCDSKFPSMQPKFGVLSGCTIIVDGVRIPSENYRVM